ncbi:MAG: hypothetical protein AAFY03_03930 [Pseudomonadota bacterium]
MRTIALASFVAASTAAADPSGLQLSKIDMPHHQSETSMAVWYPNGGGGETTTFGENPVFEGVPAAIGARIRGGTYPVVLFSHGMGGTMYAQAWLGAGLAERGAIVVSVNHPNTTWGNFDMSEGVKHWTRAADLSVALDALIENPAFAEQIDRSRIMAAGFSYGGWTALSMGGATGNHKGTVDACLAHEETMEACDMLLSEKVNIQGLDPSDWNASYSDDRITHVASIDPGFVWGLAPSDTAGLVPNVLMIGFGGEADRMLATNFDASGLSGLIDGATFKIFDPAFHFTAMPVCKPAGEAILKEEKDDPVCTDPEGTDRSMVHAAIVEAIAEELGL